MDIPNLNWDLDKVVKSFEESLTKIQVWKASTWLIEELDVYIPSWWQTQKLQWLAQVSLLDPQTIKIESWDKSVLWAIEKAIYDSNLWFAPVNQWDWIMIKIPPITEERRKEVVKVIKKELEQAKIKVRNVRHEHMKTVKNMFDNKEITEDEKKKYENKIDDVVKEYNKKLELLAQKKEESVMTI